MYDNTRVTNVQNSKFQLRFTPQPTVYNVLGM